MAQRPPPMRYQLQDLLIKQGSLLIFGAPGVMKSWLSLQLGFCLATGQPFVSIPVEQARTLIINFEIASHGYHWRVIDMGGNYEVQPQYFYELTEHMLFIEDDANLEYLAEKMRPVAPEVIILDCMSCFFGGDENNGEQVGKLWYNMRRLAQEYEASIVLVHHDNKNMFASGLASARGSTRIIGYVDSVIRMVEQPSCKQLQFLKARHARGVLPRSFNVFFENYSFVRHERQQQE